MSALLCVKDSSRRRDPPYIASDWFILRGAFLGWLDLGTKDWWISLGLVISVSQSELLELRQATKTKVCDEKKAWEMSSVVFGVRLGQIAWLSHSKHDAWQLCICVVWAMNDCY